MCFIVSSVWYCDFDNPIFSCTILLLCVGNKVQLVVCTCSVDIIFNHVTIVLSYWAPICFRSPVLCDQLQNSPSLRHRMSHSPEMKDDPMECPLCMEPLEIDDVNFFPCTCGYQICRFCWHRIRTDENGLCPACRKVRKRWWTWYQRNSSDLEADVFSVVTAGGGV